MENIKNLPYAERKVVVIQTMTDRIEPLIWGVVIPFYSSYQLYKSYKSSNSLIKRLTPREASSQLTFPVGHPQTNQAYIGHPQIPSLYLPFFDFHRYIFEEKVNELVTLLASLGAEYIYARCTQGYKKSGGMSLNVAVPGDMISAGAEAQGYKSRHREATFEEHYSPSKPPCIPDGLVWYNHEPNWRALTRRRLEFNALSFKTQVQHTEDYGVNAALKVGLEGEGISIGGNFAEFESTVWEFEGRFSEIKDT